MERNTRIEAIKYYGIIGMCLLHSSYLIKDLETKISWYNVVESVAGICLPLYFFLSAFFFAYKYSADRLPMKIVSRIKSIFIPYVFWNLFCIGMYHVLNFVQKRAGGGEIHKRNLLPEWV